MADTGPKETPAAPTYVPPAVWEWHAAEGNPFAQINRPTAGARTEAALPVGDAALQLYSLGTPNGQKVTILLEELVEAGRLDTYDAWLVDIMAGAQFTSGFVAANPNSKIPALVDHAPAGGGEPLRVFESGSILVYLAEKYGMFLPPATGAGADARVRTEVLNWLFWQMGSVPYVGNLGHFYAYHEPKLEYPINRFAMETKRLLDVLDQRLAVTPYVAGDTYSIADMAIWPWYGGLVLGRMYAGSDTFLATHEYPHVLAWARRIDARPAVRRGRIVNKATGPPHEQLRERHHASDFDTKTQDKVHTDDTP